MNSTNASSSNPSKKIKLTIIPPRQLFVNISSDEDISTTPSPTTTSLSPTPPNTPSKTTSTNQTSSSQENTSSSFHSKLQISPPSSHELTSPHHLNPLLDNISNVPPRPLNTQPLQNHELTEEEEENKEGDEDMEGEQEQDEEDDMYRDVNINRERSDAEMTNAQANQDTKDTHVTLTTVLPVLQQQSSSVSSDLVLKFINPSSDTRIDSILNPNIQTHTFINVPVSIAAETPHSAISSIPSIVNNYLASKIKEAVDVAVQLQTNKLREEAQAKNQEFLNQIEKYVTESLGAKVLVRSINQPQTSYAVAASFSKFKLKKILIDKIEENQSVNRLDIQSNLYNALVESYNSNKDIFSSNDDLVTLKRGIDDQDKDEDPSAGSNRGSKRKRLGKEDESSKELTHKESKSTNSSKYASRSQPKSLGKSAHVEEHGQKVVDLEDQSHQEFNTGNDDETYVREALDVDESQWNPSSSLTLNRGWHKIKTIDNRPPQPWITQMAQAAGTQSLFNELLATPIDFSAFIMNRLKIDNLTQEILTGLTYDLIKGTCKSVVELEYHLEENECGRQFIPLDYFINKDLEYLKGGCSSQKYTISITKTKAADYGQVKWIEDKDGQLYKFRDGDFKRLRRQDIEDMLLPLVQNEMNKNHMMCTDELHKVGDGTLNHVRTALNDIATGIEMDYLPKRK
uniref:Uncharacterized protein n=1 Tax=Tanacetum cinerariifolium TaxID=118510 RepID=A0A6L2M7N5_TANCI|nr:hypothetical protein [Tanacetum cinerariifolium]